jgi:uncharacterized protein YraI
MDKKRVLFSVIIIFLAIISCNLPGSQTNQGPSEGLSAEELAGTITALASVPQGATSQVTPATVQPSEPQITITVTFSPVPCTPSAIANTNANIRSGPGTVYPAVDSINAGASVNITGKNAEGTWWYISRPSVSGGSAWIAASVVTASCIPATLAVIPAPPTPVPPSGTCKDGYVYRLIRASDKVCVSPASKAQADADNAAAESRKVTSTYGPNTCSAPYVWRDAFPGDYVCVEVSVRSQAAADNAAAASRWVVGAYGPKTCIAPYVWRDAIPGNDYVCVEVSVRSQAAADNAAAESRKATSTYGPNTCSAPYVWRDAFSGDYVCVEVAVRSQVAADNADAPNHTWP